MGIENLNVDAHDANDGRPRLEQNHAVHALDWFTQDNGNDDVQFIPLHLDLRLEQIVVAAIDNLIRVVIGEVDDGRFSNRSVEGANRLDKAHCCG